MIQINKLYGIFANGAPETEYCYRYSNVSRVILDDRHREYIALLIPETLSGTSRAVSAELLIQLMSSGETWPEFINAFDPHNTYDQRLDPPYNAKGAVLTMDLLKQWIARNPFLTDKYPLERSNSVVEKLIRTLYSFCQNVR